MLDWVVSCAGEWKHVLLGLNEVTGRSASVMMNKSTSSDLGNVILCGQWTLCSTTANCCYEDKNKMEISYFWFTGGKGLVFMARRIMDPFLMCYLLNLRAKRGPSGMKIGIIVCIRTLFFPWLQKLIKRQFKWSSQHFCLISVLFDLCISGLMFCYFSFPLEFHHRMKFPVICAAARSFMIYCDNAL